MKPLLLASLLLLAAPALADESSVELKPGAGLDQVQAGCSGCHSLDYIQMNSVFLTPDGWKAEVNKMRQAYGAPIDQPMADEILRYLAAQYGAAPKS
jgi:mono/diheme cytochrome c family protein